MGDLSVDPVTFWERLSKLHKMWNVRPAARANVKETRAGLKGWECEWVGVGTGTCHRGTAAQRSPRPSAARHGRCTPSLSSVSMVCIYVF